MIHLLINESYLESMETVQINEFFTKAYIKNLNNSSVNYSEGGGYYKIIILSYTLTSFMCNPY